MSDMNDGDHHDHSRIDLNYKNLNLINGKNGFYDVINKNYYYDGKQTKFGDKSDNFTSGINLIDKDEKEKFWKNFHKEWVDFGSLKWGLKKRKWIMKDKIEILKKKFEFWRVKFNYQFFNENSNFLELSSKVKILVKSSK